MSWSSAYIIMFYLVLNGDSHWTSKKAADYVEKNNLNAVLVQACHDAELIDKREEDSLITPYPEQLDQQIEIMRTRWQELAWQPRVSDADRFPEEQWLRDQMAFNREMYNLYEKQASFYSEHYQKEHFWYTEALSAIEGRYNLYSAVATVACPHYYVTTKRKWLMELKELMGTDAYMAGRLPSIVPLEFMHRFE